MKKYIYRMLALVVLTLKMSNAEASDLHRFLQAYDGEIKLESFKDFLRGTGNPVQGADWIAPSTGQKIKVVCNPEYYRREINIAPEDIDRITVKNGASISGQYCNTGWNNAGYAQDIGSYGRLTSTYNYFVLDGVAKAKTNCANPQKSLAPAPKPAPIVQGKMLFLPCYNKMIEMAPDGRYSKDSNFYLPDGGSWEYFTGLRTIYGREFKKLDCTPKVETKVVYQTQVVEKVVYVQQEPITTYQQMPVQASMGRAYSSPGWWEMPPMPNYNVRQRTVFFSLALNLIPQYGFTRMPQMYNNMPVWQGWSGNPQDGGNHTPIYYYGGNPNDAGSNFSYYNPNQIPTQNWGGGPQDGTGYVPGTAQRVW